MARRGGDAGAPSIGVALAGDPDRLAARLGRWDPPVVGRVHEGRLVLDLRTVPAELDEVLTRAVEALVDRDG